MGSDTRSQRRSTILAAAEREFSKHGFESATIEEIARIAGIGKSTVYEYFPSKTELLSHVLDCSAKKMNNALERLLGSDLPFYDKLIELCNCSKDLSAGESMAKLITMCDSAPAKKFLRDRSSSQYKTVSHMMMGAIDQARANHEIREDIDSTVLANLVFVMAITVTNHFFQTQNKGGQGIVDLLFSGIGRV